MARVGKVNSSRSKPIPRALPGLLFAVGLVLLLASSYMWWTKIYNNPERVFWATIENGLSTPSVTRLTGQQNQQGSFDQATQVTVEGQATARSLTSLKQPVQNGENSVTTESIGTRSVDYVRYVDIKTGAAPGGRTPNFNSVKGVWARNEGPQFFNESVFGIMPFANLDRPARKAFISYIRTSNVYEADFSKVKKTSVNGRNTFTYTVQIKPQAYVRMLQRYAQTLGLGQADGLNPDAYSGTGAQTVEFTVDTLSRQLKSVAYSTGENRTERYAGYGLDATVEVPKQSIPVSELQQRLQSL